MTEHELSSQHWRSTLRADAYRLFVTEPRRKLIGEGLLTAIMAVALCALLVWWPPDHWLVVVTVLFLLLCVLFIALTGYNIHTMQVYAKGLNLLDLSIVDRCHYEFRRVPMLTKRADFWGVSMTFEDGYRRRAVASVSGRVPDDGVGECIGQREQWCLLRLPSGAPALVMLTSPNDPVVNWTQKKWDGLSRS